jgi:hypothetical protein
LFVFTKVVIEMGFGAFWKLTLFNEEPWWLYQAKSLPYCTLPSFSLHWVLALSHPHSCTLPSLPGHRPCPEGTGVGFLYSSASYKCSLPLPTSFPRLSSPAASLQAGSFFHPVLFLLYLPLSGTCHLLPHLFLALSPQTCFPGLNNKTSFWEPASWGRRNIGSMAAVSSSACSSSWQWHCFPDFSTAPSG